MDFSRLRPGGAGWIDRVEETGAGRCVSGWSLVPAATGLQPPVRLLVLVDDRLVAEWTPEIARDDVLAGHPTATSDRCGFSGVVTETGVVSVFAECPDGTVRQLEDCTCSGLQLELTGKCNLRCAICPSVNFSRFHNQVLSVTDIETLTPAIRAVGHLCFDGFGEVLTYDGLERVLHQVPRSTDLLFHTNGVLLDPARSEILLRYAPPLRRLVVSFDAATPETYRMLRGGDFDQVVGNCRAFIAERNRRGLHFPRLVINMTVMRCNLEEVERFVSLAHALDGACEFGHLYEAVQLNEARNNAFTYATEGGASTWDALNEALRRAFDLGARLGVEISLTGSRHGTLTEPDEFGYAGERRSVDTCPEVDRQRMLFADGRAQFCVWQTAPLYDWRESGVIDPRDHPRGQEVRQSIRSGVIPYECSGAACMYVCRRHSNQPAREQTYEGGWSGRRRHNPST